MNKLQKVDGTVQQGGLKFAFKVDIIRPWLYLVHVVRDIYEGDNVDGKLPKDRSDDIGVEDVRLRSLL